MRKGGTIRREKKKTREGGKGFKGEILLLQLVLFKVLTSR